VTTPERGSWSLKMDYAKPTDVTGLALYATYKPAKLAEEIAPVAAQAPAE
jgi:hypothetical protein